MKYMDRLEQIAQQATDIGFDAGVQKCCDLFLVALAQSEGFGEARIRRVCEAVRALEREYGKAWRNEPESDWAQEQIDRVLRGVCGADFAPFGERNMWLRKLRYR